MSLKPNEYQDFYEKVGRLNGWNFSQVKKVAEGVEWDFFKEVAQRCKKSDLLLDIGTGGGEAVLSMSDAALLLIGIDLSTGMIETAKQNVANSNKTNVRFIHMDAESLQLPQNFINVVSCRHSPFSAAEIARVLVTDGVFLTQQVSEDDKKNITHAFGRGQKSVEDGTLKNKYILELTEAGFSDVQSFEYDATEYYETYEDLVFLLKYTPIIPNFGQNENDFNILNQFIEENQTDRGIKTNSKRFMIIARKG